MSGRRRWLLALWLASSCGPQGPDAGAEIAAELRALRLALPAPGSAPAASADARATLGEALAPLREAVLSLAAEQQQATQRQASLAQELQRWTQLLAAASQGTAKEEVAALQQRLAELEQAMRQQESRHREVEELLRGALDRTTTRLEEFLQRLPVRAGNAAAPATPAATEPPTATPPGGGEEPRRSAAWRPAGGHGSSWWWVAAAGGGVLTAVGCWRLLRLPGASPRPAAAAPAPPGGEVGFDRGVEEIWRTAALLGEAVERLKQPVGEGDPGVVEPAPLAAPTPPAPPPAVAPGPRASGPPRHERRLAAAEPLRAAAAVAALLAQDPRVLRRPAPQVTRTADGIVATYHVLPGLPDGEHADLLRCLRHAAG